MCGRTETLILSAIPVLKDQIFTKLLFGVVSHLSRGMGAQVKKTVMNKKVFLPQMSDSAPIRGAERKERMPLIPLMRPDEKGSKANNSGVKTKSEVRPDTRHKMRQARV